MKIWTASCVLLSLVLSAPQAGNAATFDDFSSLTYQPVTSGSLTNGGVTAVFSGDDGSFFSSVANSSSNAILLGNNSSSGRLTNLTITFDILVTQIVFEFDAMHAVQNDAVTASAGTWTSFPATLSLSGNTLTSTAGVINPGGSGIDDDLFAILSFGAPTSSITLSNTGAFGLDAITVVPEPTSLALVMLGLIASTSRPARSTRLGS